ncbi:MAG: transposase, partial [Anaerolineaceae bacterium]|nr:transposase [Anaerolineaceae bacterium]
NKHIQRRTSVDLTKQQLLAGKYIIGIDPAKDKHQAIILDPDGLQLGKSFCFDVSFEGYTNILWKKITFLFPRCNPENIIFAIETSCNLWTTLAFYLRKEGYTVVMVSPLTTHLSRPMAHHDFSRTDPKDALLVASNAQQGNCDLYQEYSTSSNAMHRLSITYDKLRKELAQNRSRLRSAIEQIFPEFLSILEPDTQTAGYLLKRYLFPQDFLSMDITQEAKAISTISRHQHGLQTLLRLQLLARHSIGVRKTAEECPAERLTVNCWLVLIETLVAQIDTIFTAVLSLAQQLPEYDILISLKGVSHLSSALFLAEVRDIHRFDHYKQIQKYAGFNLRLSQSGRYVGSRHISHLGNKRLQWLLYCMAEETAKWVPEVRIKFLRRQLKFSRYRKNIVASTTPLLKLIMSLVKEQRPYQIRTQTVVQMRALEQQVTQRKEERKKQKKCAA